MGEGYADETLYTREQPFIGAVMRFSRLDVGGNPDDRLASSLYSKASMNPKFKSEIKELYP